MTDYDNAKLLIMNNPEYIYNGTPEKVVNHFISKFPHIYKNNKEKLGLLKLDKYFIWLSKYSSFNKLVNEYNKLIMYYIYE